MEIKQKKIMFNGTNYIRLGCKHVSKQPIGVFFTSNKYYPKTEVKVKNILFADWLLPGGYLEQKGYKIIDGRKVPRKILKELK